MNERRNSMDHTIFPLPIYNFLEYANDYVVEKSVLDCGAGGRRPPLALFLSYGYKTYGIDISDSKIDAANAFASKNNMELNIQKADMRQIPFRNETFGCVYSWNSSVHLTKKDTELAIAEMLRVLKKGGLLYVNFIWKKGLFWFMDLGEERNPGEFWTVIDGEEIVHSSFSEHEPDRFFEGLEILYKQKRQTTISGRNEIRNPAYLDYVVRK